MHAEQLLGLGVVGLELVIADRPGRRDAVLALKGPEVLAPEARQGRAIDLGAAADDVVDRGMKGLAVPVEIRVGGAIALGDEDLPRAVIRTVTGEEVSHEELGGAAAHMERSGVAHLVAADEDDLYAQIRYLLSFLPSNNLEDPPWFAPDDDPERESPELDDARAGGEREAI